MATSAEGPMAKSIEGKRSLTPVRAAAASVSSNGVAEVIETRVVGLASAVEDRLQRWSSGLPEWLIPLRVSSGGSLRSMLSTLQPAVLFLEINLPELGGMRAVGQLALSSPSTKIVLVSGHLADSEALAAARSGAWGYVHHDLDGAMVTRISESVMREEHWIPRRILSGLILDGGSRVTRAAFGSPLRVPRTPSLSRRETEIARYVLDGVSNKEIATRLAITEATVKAHLTVVFRKLGVTSRLQLGLLLAKNRDESAAS